MTRNINLAWYKFQQIALVIALSLITLCDIAYAQTRGIEFIINKKIYLQVVPNSLFVIEKDTKRVGIIRRGIPKGLKFHPINISTKTAALKKQLSQIKKKLTRQNTLLAINELKKKKAAIAADLQELTVSANYTSKPKPRTTPTPIPTPGNLAPCTNAQVSITLTGLQNSNYIRGSGPLGASLSGDISCVSSVAFITYSYAEGVMMAYASDAISPYEYDQTTLALIPDGDVEFQAYARLVNGRIIGSVAVPGAILPASNSSSSVSSSSVGSSSSISPPPPTNTPTATATSTHTPTATPTATVASCSNPQATGSFVLSGNTYVIGSGDIPFQISGDTNCVQGVVFQTWSNVAAAVQGAVSDNTAPFAYPGSSLALVTPGSAYIQAFFRYTNGSSSGVFSQLVTIANAPGSSSSVGSSSSAGSSSSIPPPTATPTTPPVATQTVTPTATSTPIASSSSSSSSSVASGSISAVFTHSKSTALAHECYAPCSVFFDATGSTAQGISNTWEDLNYSWDFGDPTAEFINRRDVASQPQPDANAAKGAIAGHVFANPGLYTVTLRVRDTQGRLGTQTATINVPSQDEVFAAGTTYCISPDGNFTGCPAVGNVIRTATVPSFDGRWTAAGRYRVLYKRGTTNNMVGYYGRMGSNSTLFIGDFGDANAPTPILNGGISTGNSRNITISGVRFVGGYDPTNGTGGMQTVIFIYEADGIGTENVLIYRTTIEHQGIAIQLYGPFDNNANILQKGHFVVDSRIVDNGDYAILGGMREGAVLGNYIKQNPNSCRDSQKVTMNPITGNNCPDHGGLRFGIANKAVISGNDFWTDFGWSSVDGTLGQPSVRLGTSARVTRTIVSENRFEGGDANVTMKYSDGSQPWNGTPDVGDAIWERNRFIARPDTSTAMEFHYPGTIIRNNVFIKPNNGVAVYSGPESVAAGLQGVVAASYLSPIQLHNGAQAKIYNNTAIILEQGNQTPYGAFLNLYGGAGAGTSVFNNIMLVTNLSGWRDFVLGGTTSLQSNIFSGPGARAVAGVNLLNPLLVNPNDFVSGFALQSTSPARSAALAVAGLHEDYFTSLRPVGNGPDIGAVESQIP